MRHVSLSDSPKMPVSHDRSLIKTLLVGQDVLPGISGISTLILPSGKIIKEHVHNEGFEVFYIISGKATALVEGRRIALGHGHCLVVEPGESHGFEDVEEDTEMVYFFLKSTV